MAKSASERRFDKRVTMLREIHSQCPTRFRLIWSKLFKGWVDEIHFRASAQLRDSADDPIPAIFGVSEAAWRLAKACGVDVDPTIADSLRHLEHISAKATASVTDRKLYRFEKDCTARLREAFVKSRVRD